MHNDNWTFTTMDTKIGSPTFYTFGLRLDLFTKATTFTPIFRLLLVMSQTGCFNVQSCVSFRLSDSFF